MRKKNNNIFSLSIKSVSIKLCNGLCSLLFYYWWLGTDVEYYNYTHNRLPTSNEYNTYNISINSKSISWCCQNEQTVERVAARERQCCWIQCSLITSLICCKLSIIYWFEINFNWNYTHKGLTQHNTHTHTRNYVTCMRRTYHVIYLNDMLFSEHQRRINSAIW